MRAAFAVRDWAEQERAPAADRREHGRGDRRARGASRERGEAMVAGDVVNTAARLQSAAPVGRSSSARRRTRARAARSSTAPPSRSREGQERPRPRLARPSADLSRSASDRSPRSPMIGRDRELGVLPGSGSASSTSGRATSSRSSARPGSASRVSELELPSSSPVRAGASSAGVRRPYGGSTPYSAFGQQVKQVAGIFDSDDAAEARAQARRRHRAASPGQRQRRSTRRTSRRSSASTETATIADRETLFFSARVFVESLALAAPTLLLYEDIHWADASLLDLLHDARRPRPRRARSCSWRSRGPSSSPSAPVGAAGSRRTRRSSSSRSPGRRAATWQPRSSPTSVSRTTAPSTSPRRRRATRCSSRSLGRDRRERLDGPRCCRRASARSSLPGSTRSRPRSAAVLVDASVVGRVFWRGALLEIAPRGDLADAPRLARGARSRSGARRSPGFAGDQQFGFKHGLIHEVAYQRLPRVARRERHAAVAGYLERDDRRRRPDQRGARAPLDGSGSAGARGGLPLVAADQAARGLGEGPRRDALLDRRSSSWQKTTPAGGRCGSDRSSPPRRSCTSPRGTSSAPGGKARSGRRSAGSRSGSRPPRSRRSR